LMMVDDAAGANGGDGAAAAGTINGAVHPMLMTPTGGEYRSGQVATAVVLPVNKLDTHGNKVSSGAFGAVHVASMLLTRSMVRQITCEGRMCESSGKDYDELVTALHHGMSVLANGGS
jgi:hypothetical protein